ncbi:MAG TPA: flagellar filament capping protein FliD [Phycisphaerae bacterium]|nr:flagellar filament capping protein FliD [Phycisphaerae bacterium]HUT59973.1 flagellar filament capping protein FliD [Phycisphaerae bacterium]
MGLTLPGVFSGIDSESIISQLMAVNSRPLYLLGNRKYQLQAKQTAVSEVERRLTQLKELAEGLWDPNGLRAVNASSSETDVLTAVASAGAGEGIHQIEVAALAAAERLVHAGVATLDTTVGEGAFSYIYNGVTRTLYTTGETTLEDLRDLINNDSANPGVTASILQYDAGGGQVYHLVLGGNDTGDDYDITVNDAGTTLDGTDGTVDLRSATFTETQDAADAKFRVDGYPPGDWITRSCNTVTDVIPNLTINLLTAGTEQDPALASITLTRNTSDLASDLQNFVAIYNGLVDTLDGYTGYDEDTKTGGVLQGESQVSTILHEVRSALIGSAGGFDAGSDSVTLPTELGFEIDRYGQLSLDTSTFDEAVSEDYLGVLALVGARGAGASDSNYIQFTGATDDTAPGAYDVEVFFSDEVVTLARIRAADSSDPWRYLDVNGGALVGQQGNPEEGLQLTAVSDGTPGEHTQTATVRVRRGFAGAVFTALDTLLDSTTGSITAMKTHLSDRVEGLNDRIEVVERRLEAQQERLEAKYARLESFLAQWDAQRGVFEALFASLAPDTSE